jgi:hypothetical protein
MADRDRMSVETICEVWSQREDGGLDAVRRMIARGDFASPEEAQRARTWVREEERRRHEEWLRTPEGSAVRAADAAVQAVEIARRSAEAAERSAKWTLVAAVMAAGGALATAVQAWVAATAPAGAPAASTPAAPEVAARASQRAASTLLPAPAASSPNGAGSSPRRQR